MNANIKYLKDESGNVISPVVSVNSVFGKDNIKLLDLFYPVGTYYETSNADFDPNVSWGGTWEEERDGLVLVSENGGGYAGHSAPPLLLGTTGGEYEHQLSLDETPKHTHNVIKEFTEPDYMNPNHFVAMSTSQHNDSFNIFMGSSPSNNLYRRANMIEGLESVGADQPHNNMQPYIVVKRWHRTK